ncbi:MAG: putative bifunctional diguanylate cyclase/phosphodiesterase [Solirubrobacteraceae bacterium]
MRLSRHGWWLYLLVMAAVAIAYLAGPLESGPVFNVIGFSAVIAIVVGVRTHKPSSRVPWYFIALGQALFVSGDVLAYNYKTFFGTSLPFPSIADPVYLLVCPITVIGLLLLIRKRSPGRDLASLLDAAMVTIGLALLSWVFLMAPYAHNSSLSLDTKLVSIAYPLGDILMLGVAVRMAVGSGRRSAAYYMMISAIVAVTLTDSIYGWIQLHSTYAPGDPLDVGWIAYYMLLGAAALHPSMRTVSHSAVPKTQLTRLRILGIAMAVLTAPIVEILKYSASGGADAFVIGGAAILLFGLVVIRMIGLARAQESMVQRERTMREAADSLVTATSRSEIVRAAQHAATMLAGIAACAAVFQVEDRDGAKCLVASGRDRGDEFVIELDALHEDVTNQLIRRQPVEIANARALLGPLAPAAPAFMVPFMMQGQLEGAVAILDATAVSVPLRPSLEALAAQVGLALESAALTERVLRSETEAWFSALVQNSSDVILVLDPDTTIQYVSPSVESMLKYPASDLIGRRLIDFMPEEDRVLLHPVMAVRSTRSSQASEAVEFRVRHRDGRWLNTESSVTNLTENRAVGAVVVNMRDITERKRFERELAYQAFHDPVTGLANRALFHDRVEHALTRRRDHGRTLAVLFLDLDNFKSINDTSGHSAGDELLQTIASRLAGALREGDTVARLGGDEFGILLENVEDQLRVSQVIERLLDAVREPLSVEGHEVSIRCSIGIAMATETADVSVDELLRNADVAMYQAKNAGGDTHELFAHEMHAALVEQLELRAALKVAIERDELSLDYQPIFDVATDEITGYEALLRWRSEQRGSISPATFIPVAEDSGLIVPIGRWVLARACKDAVEFQRMSSEERRTISVNLSARQLRRIEIVDEVRDALDVSGLDPSCLVLEITESMMIDDVELAIERLDALRDLGVLLAVDDFGKGYSSLNYIRRLPIDILKIDKSFIDGVVGPHAQGNLTSAIVDLARVLKLQCVAEGVERAEQYERLKELGCDKAQGFLLARPMSAESIRERLQAGASAPISLVVA